MDVQIHALSATTVLRIDFSAEEERYILLQGEITLSLTPEEIARIVEVWLSGQSPIDQQQEQSYRRHHQQERA